VAEVAQVAQLEAQGWQEVIGVLGENVPGAHEVHVESEEQTRQPGIFLLQPWQNKLLALVLFMANPGLH